MSIVAEELKLYRDISGRLSNVEVVHNHKNGLFPDVSEADQLAGITLTKKVFFKVANDADTQGVNAKTFIADITPGGSRAIIYDGSQRDTAPTGRKYGAGRLFADVSIGAVSIVVDAEPGNGANLIFQVGDELYINDGTNDETVTVSGVSWATDRATITISALVNAYLSAAPTTVSSCIESATIECITDNWVEASTSGTYDETASPVTNDNLAGIEQTWTLTFTSTTEFSVVGDTVGSIGTGSIVGNFAALNPNYSKPYFTLLAAGWGGSWVTNDTIVFQTHPATQPFFAELTIPPGTTAYSNDDVQLSMLIESA